jgi:hypothetical protein
MVLLQVTIQHLITNGFDPKAKKDPYRGFVYTSFQVRAPVSPHPTHLLCVSNLTASHVPFL